MSESVSRGVAAVTIGACGAMVVASAKAVHQVVSSVVHKMSEASQRDYEYLLSVAPSVTNDVALTAAEACAEVSCRVADLKAHLAESKYQVTEARLIPMVALAQSSLGRTVKPQEWQTLAGNTSEAAFGKLLDDTSRSWAANNYRYLVNSVLEVARSEGFSTPLKQKVTESRAVLSLADAHGRAVIAKLSNQQSGVTVDLDLSGFKGDDCHKAMDRIMHGLASKNITLRQAVRRKHLTLDHLKVLRGQCKEAGPKEPRVSTTDERRRQAEILRRSRVNESIKKTARN